MSVPKFSAIHPGTPVNIVLKADQRTGRLTSGYASEILTRGDHPRGVKVRLADGSVGRVQSLGTGPPEEGMKGSGSDQASRFARGGEGIGELGAVQGLDSGIGIGEVGSVARDVIAGGRGRGGGGFRGGRIQDDVRNDPVPVEERSLEDYMKPVSRNKAKKGKGQRGGNEKPTTAATQMGEDVVDLGKGSSEGREGAPVVQKQLEEEFPGLDSALIAAIVADHGERVEAARQVLRGLG